MVSKGGAAAKTGAVATTPAAASGGRAADDTSPLLTRRAWMGLAWGAFSAASAAALAATGRFMFPNVLNEPPQQFRAGFPNEYGMGVDERWKEKFGIWLVRTPDDPDAGGSGFFALITVCTHLGCTPNYLAAELKFKCPCHGSGFRTSGINFEGPAPRPLERARIVLADDGQILVDRSRKFQRELGQWIDPEAFLRALNLRILGYEDLEDLNFQIYPQILRFLDSQILRSQDSDITVWLTPRPSLRRKARSPVSGTG